MAVSRRLRFEILRRDGYTCRYCGAQAPDVTLTVDHVLPVALGGGDEPNNLVTACTDCNAGKTSIAPDSQIVEDVDAAAFLFARAAEVAAARRRESLGILSEDLAHFAQHWNRWRTEGGSGPTHPMEDDWQESLTRFLSHDLAIDELFEFCDQAMRYGADSTFRFFCHLCWKEIGIRQEMAFRLIEDGEV